MIKKGNNFCAVFERFDKSFYKIENGVEEFNRPRVCFTQNMMQDRGST